MRSYHLDKPGQIDGIVLREHATPTPTGTQILVRVHAAAFNKRDTMILHERYPMPTTPGVIPLSDGAGEVVAVGADVTRFEVGDRVIGGYWPRWHEGRLRPELLDQLGCTLDGMLTEFAILDEEWAVRAPDHLTWEEAATLPCAALTAWTSLTGGEPLRRGDTVLTLGTGSVSLFAVQFAKMLGYRVISTTSSANKATLLKALGADHVVNYADNPAWGQEVRDLTGGAGADLVVETVGPETMEQSLLATALYGQIVILITGNAAGDDITLPNKLYASSLATFRRVFVGNRSDLEAMAQAISAHQLRPVVDLVFDFEEAHEAFAYYQSATAFGKVVVRIP